MPVQTIKEKSKSTLHYKVALVVLVLIIIALVAVSPLTSMAMDNRSKTEESVKGLFSIISGSTADLLKTVEEHGLYHMTIRVKTAAGQDSIQEVFVTKDGAFVTNNLVDLELQKSLLTNQSAFAQCLYNKGVRILGVSTDQGTQLQLQALGAFSGRLYIDCGGTNLALCQQMNITQVPVIFVSNTLLQGPQPESWFEQNIGCYMTANATKV